MTLAPLYRRAASLRAALKPGSLGLVPTMGALHEGHLSLVRRALRDHKQVAVSIFVNPTQFGRGEDFGRYPRTLVADRRLLSGLGRVLVYAPAVEEVYPRGFVSSISVGGSLGTVLEAAWRPGHFQGVATVVARLFGLLKPQSAYFGLKDYQQFRVLERMTRDLALPVKLLGCPTRREADGLALSSRNRYLSPSERESALALSRALTVVKGMALSGERSAAKLQSAGRKILSAAPGLKIQYFALAGPDDLAPIQRLDRPAVALTACMVGTTRLIDNIQIQP